MAFLKDTFKIYFEFNFSRSTRFTCFVLGWSGGAMVLGNLPVPGCPTNLVLSRARAYCPFGR